MFDRSIIFSIIVAIFILIFSEILIFWIAKKTKMVQMDTSGLFKKKDKKYKKVEVVCPHCGADNPPENNFCGSCRKPL